MLILTARIPRNESYPSLFNTVANKDSHISQLTDFAEWLSYTELSQIYSSSLISALNRLFGFYEYIKNCNRYCKVINNFEVARSKITLSQNFQ